MIAASTGSEDETLLHFVERFALLLTATGLARMPARVFAYAMVDDADRYSANELAEALRVSPAAISVAVRDLIQAGLLSRQREPGDRTDTYVLTDGDLWSRIYFQRAQLVEPFERIAAEGVELLGRERPSGRRMAEAQAFYAFLRREMPQVMQRWRQHRRRILAGMPAVDAT